MKRCIRPFPAIAAFAMAAALGSADGLAQYAYITNSGSNTVSRIRWDSAAGNVVDATIPVGVNPYGVAVAPDGSAVYVTNHKDGTVSVIMGTQVAYTVRVGDDPHGLAVTPDGGKVYVAAAGKDIVTIFDATKPPSGFKAVKVGNYPWGVAITPDGSRAYVTNAHDNTVSVIDTTSDAVIGSPIAVGDQPTGVAVTPDGSKVYTANYDNLSVIDTKTNAVTTIGLPGFTYGASHSFTGGLAITPDGAKLYVTGHFSVDGSPSPKGAVAEIDTSTDTLIGDGLWPVEVGFGGSDPAGVGVTPDGTKVYVALGDKSDQVWILEPINSNSVAIYEAAVGLNPVAFGQFIGPAPKAAALTAVQPAPPAGNACSGLFDGTINGDLTVAAGQSCRVVNGGQITGNVTVSGGKFVLSGAAVGGSVTVDGGSFTLGPASTVGGDVLVSNLPAGVTDNSVCGTTVEGTLQVDGNAAPVQIGSASPMVCAGNKIGGNLTVNGNSAAAQVFDNHVTGALQANSNTGPLDVVGNTVGTTLQCQNNTALIMGGNNAATQTTGQCN
jgi:YVTN family beta-propeller protein